MSEPKPILKSGDAIDFTVGDKTLTIEPVPYGQIKKIIRIAFDASKDLGSVKMAMIPDMIDQNLSKIFPLLFAKGRYPFVTDAWIEENMTVPTLRKMLEAAVVVNGLQDFFDQAAGRTKGPIATNGAPPTPPTPPERDGSTTSADLAMAGAPKT